MSIAAVVLAAGEASRFGTPKQRLLLPERVPAEVERVCQQRLGWHIGMADDAVPERGFGGRSSVDDHQKSLP